MGKLVISLILAILLLIFTSQNMHEVTVRTIFGPPVEMPMILALFGAFIVGFAVATFRNIIRASKQNEYGDD